MASGFSLGAAIGATGKFPKLKAPEVDTSISDRQARELQAIRNSLTSDNNTYHNIYLKKNHDDIEKNIATLLEAERTKDPNVIEKAYKVYNDTKLSQSRYANLSLNLFKFEAAIEANKGGKSEFYISPSMEKAYEIIKSSDTEEDMYLKFLDNPEILADKYFQFAPTENGVTISPIYRPKVDFEKTFGRGEVFKFNEAAVLMDEQVDPTTKGQITRRYYSIPADRQEALELKKKNPNINENNNAYDMGLSWFKGNQDAQDQYRSMLYHSTKDMNVLDPNTMTTEKLYDELYKNVVLYNIPAKYENRDQLERRTTVNVNVDTVGTRTAPTDFSVGVMTVNYGTEGKTLRSDLSASVSSNPSGTELVIPGNPYIIGLKSTEPEFFNNPKLQTFEISRVAVVPAVLAKKTYSITSQDGKKTIQKTVQYLCPISEDQAKQLGSGNYLMYPFAFGNQKQINQPQIPGLGVHSYAIPLYEPDANGRWVIPQDYRKIKTTGGSPLLSQITQRNAWGEESQKNWDNSFFKMMAGVKDQNDIKQK